MKSWQNSAMVAAFMVLTAGTPALADCAPQGKSELRDLGDRIGGAFGGILGGKVGEWMGGGAAADARAAGVGLGILANRGIFASLNTCEQQQAADATQAALNSAKVGAGSKKTWTSDTTAGVGGSTTVTDQSKQGDGRVCRTAVSIVNVKGKERKQSDTYCKDARTGSWQLLEA